MTRTTPLRLMTLHLGQMGLTDARTFMTVPGFGSLMRRRKGSIAIVGRVAGGRSCSSQDPGALVEDRDGVLEVRRELSVGGHRRPLIVEYLDVRGPGVYHRLHGDDKAALDAFSAARLTIVGDGRVLVHAPADAVADERRTH